MDNTEQQAIATAPQPDPIVVAAPINILKQRAIDALAHPNPDGPALSMRAAWRDWNCKGSGDEAYRRVRYPGSTEDVWPDSERLPAPGIRSSDRHCTVHCEAPAGTLVITFARDCYHGRRGKCSVSFAIAVENPDKPGETALVACEHRTLRSRPVYEITLPDGTTTEVARRQ